jgi:hypothetical protein
MMNTFPIADVGVAFVVAVYGVDGNGMGKSSEVAYDVAIRSVSGQTLTLPFAIPNQWRPPDIVKLVAARVGQTGFASKVVLDANTSTWFFNVTEGVNIVECPPQ